MSQKFISFSSYGSRLSEVVVGAKLATQQEDRQHEGRPLKAEMLDLPGGPRAGDAGLATETALRQAHHQLRPGEENEKQVQTSRLGARSDGIRTVGAANQ